MTPVTAEIKADSSKEGPNDQWTGIWLRPRRLLIAAAIFHLVVTAGICTLGHYGVLPGVIDSNGIVVALASDGTKLRAEAVQLRDELTRGHIRDWFNQSSPFHIKFHSIFFALLERLFGSTILSAEPVNALCYLAILILTFYLGREIFCRRVGLVAAAVVALWPSFLLHTTQPLRDPLFIAGVLAFIVVNVRMLSRDVSWGTALLTAASGGLIVAIVWLSRDTMQEVLIATAGLAGVLLLVRQFAAKYVHAKSGSGAPGWRARAPNLIGIALLVTLTVGVTRVIPKFRRPYGNDLTNATTGQDNIWQNSRRQKRETLNGQVTPANPWSRFVARVGKLRQGFVTEFSDAGSNIDSEVQINRTVDLVRYLPRAAMIGFFAPFPNMWLVTGNQVGRSGKLLSGFETLAMYLVEVFSIVGLWSGRRRVSVWFLGLVAVMGMISLGLVVVNVGALYRLRYAFVILLIILGTEGASLTFESFEKEILSRRARLRVISARSLTR